MIVLQSEIDLIQRGRRRQMMLPIERGPQGERLPCKLESETCVSLQPRAFVKGTRITVTSIEAATLGDLDAAVACKQGYAGVQGMREAFEREHGDSSDDRAVWLVNFIRGDHTAFYAEHAERFLSRKRHNTTTDVDRALPTEPAVTTADLARIAAAAAEKRAEEERAKLKAARTQIRMSLTVLEGLDAAAPAEKEIRWMRRRLDAIERSLGIAA